MSKVIEKQHHLIINLCMSEPTKLYRFLCHFLELIINDITSYSIIR